MIKIMMSLMIMFMMMIKMILNQVGSSLTLPCNTTNLGDLVLLWRQVETLLIKKT